MGNSNNDQSISQPFLVAINSPMPAVYHTKHVLTKQNKKIKKEENEMEDDVSDNDSQDDDLEEVDNLNSID